MIYVLLYLFAIVLANLLVAQFGVYSVFIIGFLFVGLDLTTRDYLHEAWHRNGLFWKMSLLIGSGSVLSYVISWLLNRNIELAGSISLASFSAFSLAGIADTLIYHLLRKHHKLVKINGSNVSGALVDSIVFPTLAFGSFMPLITLGQFLAKIGGGFVWSVILLKTEKR
jgi:uncharacterized PurR-regulated membrane protein YhhQ (DUF165 family)